MTQEQQINLVINKMTQAQYNSITPVDTELYFITDEAPVTSQEITDALGYTPQAQLTAGTNITIEGNTISAAGTTYSAGNGININGSTISVATTIDVSMFETYGTDKSLSKIKSR